MDTSQVSSFDGSVMFSFLHGERDAGAYVSFKRCFENITRPFCFCLFTVISHWFCLVVNARTQSDRWSLCCSLGCLQTRCHHCDISPKILAVCWDSSMISKFSSLVKYDFIQPNSFQIKEKKRCLIIKGRHVIKVHLQLKKSEVSPLHLNCSLFFELILGVQMYIYYICI